MEDMEMVSEMRDRYVEGRDVFGNSDDDEENSDDDESSICELGTFVSH